MGMIFVCYQMGRRGSGLSYSTEYLRGRVKINEEAGTGFELRLSITNLAANHYRFSKRNRYFVFSAEHTLSSVSLRSYLAQAAGTLE